ncbi:MAG: hypothetical protein OXE73_10190 [Gammaproteobacteria bacterium]|nr:hypothetical protein [Gammaproteobacteria bacterium]
MGEGTMGEDAMGEGTMAEDTMGEDAMTEAPDGLYLMHMHPGPS